MNLEIKNLVFAPVGEKESFNIELYKEKIEEDVLAERIKGTLKLTRLEESILGVFEGTTRVNLACDRCLTDFTVDMTVKFSQEYVLNRAEATEEKPAVNSHFEIEVFEPMRQEIAAALPVKKLCSGECKGICARCGKNLNVEKCICKKKSQ